MPAAASPENRGGSTTIDPQATSSPQVRETQPAVLTPKYEDVNSNIGGFYEALPANYDSSQHNYPLIVFLHGVGELGNGRSQLPGMVRIGLPELLRKKQFPPEFTVQGKHYSFIIVAPQFKGLPSIEDVNTMISYAKSRYRVDDARIYVCGLSLGGGATWAFASQSGSTIAAAVPVCGGLQPDQQLVRTIAESGLPVWAFHNTDDSVVPVSWTKGFVSGINSLGPKVPAKLTVGEGGHDAWTIAFDPLYKENNLNIYEWMLQYSRGQNR